MKRVLATGTFDLLHPGHTLYLEQSRALGDELVVVVARDANVRHKPKPIVPEEQRLKMVQSLRVVDKAVLGDQEDIFRTVEILKPNIITLGFDQHFDPCLLTKELKQRNLNPEVVRIESKDLCELCSSHRIASKILARFNHREKKE